MEEQLLQSILAQQARLLEQLVAIAKPSGGASTGSDGVMDMLSKCIKEFVYNPEANQTFENWYARYDHLFGEDANKLADAEKVKLVLRKLEPEVFDKYADYLLPKVPRDLNFETTVSTLKTLFGRRESLFSSRVACMQFTKTTQMDFFTYGAMVNRNCDNFEFGKLTENQFKCLMFLRGLQAPEDADVRARLLHFLEGNTEDTVTIDKMVSEVNRMLSLRKDAAVVEQNVVHAVKRNHKQHKVKQQSSAAPSEKPRRPCWQCGEMHFAKNCSYSKHLCEQCGIVGHKEGYCSCFAATSKQRSEKKSKKKQYSKAQVSVTAVRNVAANRKHVSVKINGVKQRLQFDTGADITIISRRMWMQINKPTLLKPAHIARDASDHVLNLLGQCEVEFEFKGKSIKATIFVTPNNKLNVMGTDLMDKLGIWSLPIDTICNTISTSEIENIKSKYPSIFSTQPGHCSTFKVNLKIKQDSQPVFKPKRPVAYAALQQVDEELQRLEQANIITPVSYSRWAAPIVVVKRSNGKVRICGDYSTGLNECMEPHTYPLPLPDDIFINFNNCQFFTQIDLTDAYMQLEVDDATKEILTINTHRGLYTFNRLAPGIKSAPGAFQQAIDTILSGVKFAHPYLDDVIIATPSKEENQHAVDEVFQRFQRYNLTININKCSFFSRSCTYLGYKVDGTGIRPDPLKISAILKMPAPTNVSELRSFLGAVNYYGKFIRKMRNLRAPMDDLLKVDREWKWSKACEDSFQEFKNILGSQLMLTHYDPRLPIKVAADASNVGIGAYICHVFPDGGEKAVYHVSRSLTPAERNYSQIEKEGLALVFAVSKFHKMLYGRRFKLGTDHKPLLAIFGSKKGIATHTASRLQRWALTLMSYDFELSYTPTQKFGCADILSRLINKNEKPEEDVVIACAQMEAEIKYIVQDNITALPITHNMIRSATSNDNTLQNIVKYLQNSWPDTKTPEELVFFQRREGLSACDGCVLYQDRMVIPKTLRQRILKQLHKGHQGIVRTKSLARSYVYWPNIDKDIEDIIKRCDVCASTAKSPPRTTLHSWPIATRPMRRIHIDFAGPVNQSTYLLIIDAFSKYPEVYPMKSTTSSSTIECLRDYCSKFGFPESLVSDNGTQFTSQEFVLFCSENGIEHIRTAPFHPQSNGQVERFVDTFKRALKKHQNSLKGIREFLLYYRATDNNNTPGGKSPSELFLGRKVRINLDLLFKPKEDVLLRNDKMEAQYNRKFNTKSRHFAIGAEVYAKVYKHNKFFWAPAIVKKQIGKVNYEVEIKVFPYFKMMKSHANQLRTRHNDTSTSNTPWFDMFEICPPPRNTRPSSEIASTSTSTLDPPASTLQRPSESSSDPSTPTQPSPTHPSTSVRRSSRVRRAPQRFRDYTS
ncbi:uncharacterized protein K02A2.6-like [Stomoxys calcitrans]|uniref:uncharacterized protein K02A2.6-like n=1 Tax=Stomoxys calcitrans TaxID=35570 RepID=UPI0027E23042|nr:uncharacterized protein K02A2.6-like [Stomoxys calcitrans]